MSTPLPARPQLSWLRKRAKDTLQQLRQLKPAARLAEAQLALAREHGFPSWRALKAEVDARATSPAISDLPAQLVDDFMHNVGSGELAAVTRALDAEPRLVNAVGPHPFWGGRPQPLHIAIEAGRLPMVKLLVARGADVNGAGEGYLYWTPLLLAIVKQPGPIVTLLKRKGAKTGLVEALTLGNDRMVLQLLKRGRRALPPHTPNGGSLLAFARTPKAIDRLLELGVSLDAVDRWGASPIETMSRNGVKGKKLVAHLRLKGALARPEMFTRMGDVRTVKGLLQTDPSLIHADAFIKGAVDFGHHRMARWLLEQGAPVNARGTTASRDTLLHSAAWNGDLEMVKLLLEAGADPTARDAEYHNTPAGWAETSIEVTNNPKCRAVADYLKTAVG